MNTDLNSIRCNPEMQKVADAADISVLFFQLVLIFGPFLAILGHFWANLGNFG